MDNLEQFKAWIDSEFSDCSWYFEAKIGKYLHLYRDELDDFWSYEETVAWFTWQSRQAELDQQKLLTVDSELHLDAAKEEIERLKGEIEEKDKRIEKLLLNMTDISKGIDQLLEDENMDIVKAKKALTMLSKALRGEHEA